MQTPTQTLDHVAQLVAARRTAEALRAAREAALAWPDEADMHRMLAWILVQIGHFEQARTVAARAVELDPGVAAGWRLLGAAHLELGQPAPAARALRRSRDLDPAEPITWDLLCTSLRRLRHHDEAMRELKAHVQRHPGHAPARAQLAVLHQELRNDEAARNTAYAALALDPQQPQALHLVAALAVKEGRLDSARRQLESILALPLPTNVRVSTTLELARLLDRLGEADAAWKAMLAAQELRRNTPATQACDITEWPRLLDDVRRWSEAHRDDPEPLVLYPRPPAFIVGFPRSGTTLVEQILDTHPDLDTTDELPVLERLASGMSRLLGRPCRYPHDLHTLTLVERATLIEAWVRAVMRLKPGSGRTVDKLPLNVAWIPLARALFPDAPVVFAVRDPRDAIVSGLFQDLVPNAAMVHLGDLETSARLYDRVMRTWQAVKALPGLNVREQRYEDLVAHPEETLRELFAFLGHPWDPEVLDFHLHAARKAISTPSKDAVSRPMTRAAQGRWHRHAGKLQEVQERLDPWIRQYGYRSAFEDVPDVAVG